MSLQSGSRHSYKYKVLMMEDGQLGCRAREGKSLEGCRKGVGASREGGGEKSAD